MSNGGFTNLHVFSGSDGSYPTGLIQGSDGNFYGATLGNGAVPAPGSDGTVFVLTPNGALTNLVIFNGTNGAEPRGLVQADDGNLYGTVLYTDANEYGAIFKVTPDGRLSTLYSFNGTNGSDPCLFCANGSNLYGATLYGGIGYSGGSISGFGTIFKITTNGVFTSLSSFGYTNGGNPAGIVLGTDGNFYGATPHGGGNGGGTLFELSFGSPPVITTQPTNQLLAPGTTAAFVISAVGTPPLTYAWQGNGLCLADDGRITGSQYAALSIANTGLCDAGPYQVIVANPYGSTTSSVAALSLNVPPAFQTVTRTAGTLSLNWSAVLRQSYQLQFKDDLNQPNWNSIGAPLIASNAVIGWSDLMTNSQRFYRMVLLP